MNNRNSYTVIIFLLLAIVIVFSGCSGTTPATTAAPTQSPAPSTTTTTTPAATTTAATTTTTTPPEPEPLTLQQMADDIAKDVGSVMSITENDPEQVIFIFEEVHNSILGQVEIAMMMNRLYERYGLRHIGLEGQSTSAGPLDLAWAHTAPYYTAGELISNREDVIIKTLEKGEISAAELIGLLYHDAVIDGIDDASLYTGEASSGAWSAPSLYLYNIALKRMSDMEYTAWKALYDAEKYDDAFNFAISTDEYATEKLALMDDAVNILQDEDWPALIDEIKAEAVSAELQMSATNEDYMNELRTYYADYVSPRSEAMAGNILKLADANPGAPVAMNIGAAHTSHVAGAISDAGCSVIVIRALSMAENNAAGLLSNDAMLRKQQGYSAAPDGFLGALLDGRKKPEPYATKTAYRKEVAIAELLQRLTNLANKGAVYGYEKDRIKQNLLDEYNNSTALTGLNESDIADFWVDVEMPGESIYSSSVVVVVFGITLKDGNMLRGMSRGVGEKVLVTMEKRLSAVRDDLKTPSTEPTVTPTETPLATYAVTTSDPPWEEICSNTQVKWEIPSAD